MCVSGYLGRLDEDISLVSAPCSYQISLRGSALENEHTEEVTWGSVSCIVSKDSELDSFNLPSFNMDAVDNTTPVPLMNGACIRFKLPQAGTYPYII